MNTSFIINVVFFVVTLLFLIIIESSVIKLKNEVRNMHFLVLTDTDYDEETNPVEIVNDITGEPVVEERIDYVQDL